MQHFFDSWQSFISDVRSAAHLLFLSDYDGTLTPIVGRPVEATLSSEVRDKLGILAKQPSVSVGIISGRALSELKNMVGIDAIYYAGNHGLEIEGPGLAFTSREAEAARAVIGDLAKQLVDSLGRIDGVLVEDKGLSLSVHYRLVKPNEEGAVADLFRRTTAPLLDAGGIRITSGKKVWEVRPPIDWHKGKAVQVIREQIQSLPGRKELLTIYLGDDTTDEDAFRVLHRPRGWSILVGGENPSSHAGYFLEGTPEVVMLLARLIELDKGGEGRL